MTVREFLEQIAKEEIIQGEQYSLRIEIDDGGFNSYIGFDVDIETYKTALMSPKESMKTPKTKALRLYRHTNDMNKLVNTWGFNLGDIIHDYPKNQNVPMKFNTYGKTWEEAEKEASQYFPKIKKLIHKRTSDLKTEKAADKEKEKEQLLARLKELE